MVASFFMRLDPNMVTHLLIEGDFVVKSIQQTESVQRLFTNDRFVHENVLKEYPADVPTDVSSYWQLQLGYFDTMPIIQIALGQIILALAEIAKIL